MSEHRFNVPRSGRLEGIEWLEPRVDYPEPEVKGDTFPLTWAADGEIYTSSGDPTWGAKRMGLDIERFRGHPPDYRTEKINEMLDYDGGGGTGPKPTGMISIGGCLYLAVQNMLGQKPPAHGEKSQHGSDATIIRSADYGLTWNPGRLEPPMFDGHLFGGPAFVNFGRDNAGARDGFVYAVSGDQWHNGSEIRVGRVPVDGIQRRAAWEWCAGLRADQPDWTSSLDDSVPVLADDRYLGTPDIVYLAGIDRYLLLSWRFKTDFGHDGSELIGYDAPEPWGPYTLAFYEPVWESIQLNPYCPRLPLKWMQADGITGWLLFSGDWQEQGKGLTYRSHVRQFRLLLR